MKSTLADLLPALSDATMRADAAFAGVSTDSRTAGPGNLFVALRGDRFDAHAFLKQVVSQGVAAVVVEALPEGLDIPALVVPDTRVALGEMARQWRARFTMPVIGVTGSNGKTTVKEMIAAILSTAVGAEHALSTRGNLNNEIGVPLTLFRLDQKCRAAVIELGMNHPGEISVLSTIALPTVGLVNNAQREHQEFMESVEAVARENGAVLRALPADGTAVFPADEEFSSLWAGYAAESGQRKVIRFGFNDDAEVRCTFTPNAFGSDVQVTAGVQQFAVSLSAAGVHNVRNALAAIACTLAIGMPVDAIVRGLESFAPVSGRLQRKITGSGMLVIDDTYNANPDSVRAAIDVLADAGAPRILVLGDMGEVGNDGPKFHEEIGAYAKSQGINHLLTLGDLAQHSSNIFGNGAVHYNDITIMNDAVTTMLTPATTVLVKGSRFMKMERVVQHLLGQPARGAH